MSDDGLGDAFEDVIEMPAESEPVVQKIADVAANVANNAIRADPAFGGAIAAGEDVFHAATSSISDMTDDDAGVAMDDAARGLQQITDGDPGDTWRAIRPEMSSVPEADREALNELGEGAMLSGQVGLGMLSADSPAGPINSAVDVIEDARDAYNDQQNADLFAERGIPGPADPNAPSPGSAEGPGDGPAPKAFRNELDGTSDDGSWDVDPTVEDPGGEILTGPDLAEVLTSPDPTSYDTSSYDTSSYDTSSDDTSSDDTSSYDTPSFEMPSSDDTSSSYDTSSSFADDSSGSTESWGSTDDGSSLDSGW
jgi:hypothetical protein